MRCSTCQEAQSEQLPVSEVCRHCHDYSRWCQSVHVYPVTLYLREYADGERYVSSSNMGRVIAKKEMLVTFDHCGS